MQIDKKMSENKKDIGNEINRIEYLTDFKLSLKCAKSIRLACGPTIYKQCRQI